MPRGAPGGGVPRQPFRLDAASLQKPSRFEVDFVINGVRHRYGFEASDAAFLSEWLYAFPKSRRRILFVRDGGESRVDRAASGSTKTWCCRRCETRPIAVFVLVDRLNLTAKEPRHLVAQPGVLVTAGAVDPEAPHEVRERIAEDQLARLRPRRFGADPRQQQTRDVAVRELVAEPGDHPQGVRPVDAHELQAVAGLAARQRAQREQPRHEAGIGFRFSRLYELIDLVELREVPRRSSCGHGQVEGEIADVNKPAAFLLFVCAHRSYTAFHARDPFRVCSSRT